MENYGAYIVFISTQHCRAVMKNVLANGIVQQTAYCGCENFRFPNLAKFSRNF